MIDKFKVQSDLIKCLISSKNIHSTIFSGEGGIGKTLITLKTIKNLISKNKDSILNNYSYISGYMTPLSFYIFLFENKDKDLIIIDDTEGILNNKLSIAMLKSILWETEGQRTCFYNSTTEKLTIPESFEMNSKIIILCNEIPNKNNLSMRALISRTIYKEINLTLEEKLNLCYEFLKQKDLNENEKKEIKRLLKEYINLSIEDFNFRTFDKLINFVKYDITKAEFLFKEILETDEEIKIFLESLVNKQVSKQVKYFCEHTGKSRATFYRIKKKLSHCLKKN
jgi:hypothetical protein